MVVATVRKNWFKATFFTIADRPVFVMSAVDDFGDIDFQHHNYEASSERVAIQIAKTRSIYRKLQQLLCAHCKH